MRPSATAPRTCWIPVPLKIVLDNVLKSKAPTGWLNTLVLSIAGTDKLAIIGVAAIAVMVIAVFGALCTYCGKAAHHHASGNGSCTICGRPSISTSSGCRSPITIKKAPGDLISTVTSDIDSIQTFITSGLLDALINVLTLVGMVAVMFYINWRFTLIALSVAPVLAVVVFKYTRSIRKASREVRKKEGEMVSVIQEVLSSMRVVKAFAREDYEVHRLEEESLENVEIALRARAMKARLSPLVEVIVAAGTALVLWFGARMVLAGSLLAGFARAVHLVPRQNVQADAGTFEDDGRVLESGQSAYERIREILDMDGEVKDLPGARRSFAA